MTPAQYIAAERTAWRRFLETIAIGGNGAGAAEALLRATWATHERQQGIRR